jgi:hypothetical protein
MIACRCSRLCAEAMATRGGLRRQDSPRRIRPRRCATPSRARAADSRPPSSGMRQRAVSAMRATPSAVWRRLRRQRSTGCVCNRPQCATSRCVAPAAISRNKGLEVAVADALQVASWRALAVHGRYTARMQLPYRSHAFDTVLCIAVLHHLSSAERRLAVAKELLRVAANGGAWMSCPPLSRLRRCRGRMQRLCSCTPGPSSRTTTRGGSLGRKTFSFRGTCRSTTPRRQRREAAQASSSQQVPAWTRRRAPLFCRSAELSCVRLVNTRRAAQRYCHVFQRGEIEELFNSAARQLVDACSLEVEDSYFDCSNWCVQLRVRK